MKKKIIAGLLVGAFLVYLSVRDINFQNVFDGFKSIRYEYMIPALIILLLIQVLKAWRWGVILSPMEKIDPVSLFSVSNVGFLAVVAIPARLGELARPYLITKKSDIKMTAAVGTIVVERIFDSITLLSFFVFVLFFIPLPQWLLKASYVFFIITSVIFVSMVFMAMKRELFLKVSNGLFGLFSEKVKTRLMNLINYFIDGLRIILDSKRFIYVAMLSVTVWLCCAFAIYFLLMAFDFKLPVIAAFVLLIILMFGIAIPAAPGFVGNWHYFCILGLSLFNIPKAEALAFSVVYHFVSIGIVVILGLIFLPFNKFSFSDLQK